MKNDLHIFYIEMRGLGPQQAMNLGGTFSRPIKDVGVVGTITVSGLAHYQEHEFVVDWLLKYVFYMIFIYLRLFG